MLLMPLMLLMLLELLLASESGTKSQEASPVVRMAHHGPCMNHGALRLYVPSLLPVDRAPVLLLPVLSVAGVAVLLLVRPLLLLLLLLVLLLLRFLLLLLLLLSLSVAGVPVLLLVLLLLPLLLVLLLLLPLHRRQSPPALDLRWCLGWALLPNE